MPATSKTAPIAVSAIKQVTTVLHLRGTTPLIMNRMPNKYRKEMLIGGKPKRTDADKQGLRQNPRAEFKSGLHFFEEAWEPRDTDGNVLGPPTHVGFPTVAFKAAMIETTKDLPGIAGTQVKRLVFLPDEYAPIYGVPQLRMDVTRQAGMTRAPQMTTRPEFPVWESLLVVRYASPMLNQKKIATLLANAGIICGIGEYRQEKGKGSFGCFELVDSISPPDDISVRQREAIEEAVPATPDIAVLLAEYDAEVEARQ